MKARLLRCFYCGSRRAAEVMPRYGLCGRALRYGLTADDIRRDIADPYVLLDGSAHTSAGRVS